MIITVSVALVSVVVLAMSNAKKEKVEGELNFLKDSYTDLAEDNRVLNACLEVMEPKLLELQKEAKRPLEIPIEDTSNLARELAIVRERAANLDASNRYLMWDRDSEKKLRNLYYNEAEAYKSLLEKATKKAPQ
jgi:hypothetical protein